jgi:hypothetical protein
MSKRGLCARCGTERITENLTALATRNGPEYERWLTRWSEAGETMLAALGSDTARARTATTTRARRASA